MAKDHDPLFMPALRHIQHDFDSGHKRVEAFTFVAIPVQRIAPSPIFINQRLPLAECHSLASPDVEIRKLMHVPFFASRLRVPAK
jgi:hypothetical protein